MLPDNRIGVDPTISLKQERPIRDEQQQRMLDDRINPCAAKRQVRMVRLACHQDETTFKTVALDWQRSKSTATWNTRWSMGQSRWDGSVAQ